MVLPASLPFAEPTSDLEFLREVPLFGSLDESELREIASLLSVRRFEPGALVFRVGDPGDELYIVRQGIVRIVMDHDGREIELTRLCAGEFFGDLALLDGAPRMASASCKMATVALVLKRKALLELLARRPHVAAGLLAVLARRIRASDLRLRSLAARNLNELDEPRTLGGRASDAVAAFGGSWAFVIAFVVINGLWIGVEAIIKQPDPYPFIFLNLLLTFVTTLVAPFIMMSQARRAAKDRTRSDLDYKVNLENETLATDVKETIEELRRLDLPTLR